MFNYINKLFIMNIYFNYFYINIFNYKNKLLNIIYNLM